MIFQEPINSLNPAFRVVDQIAESLRVRHMRESGQQPAFRPEMKGFDYSKRELPRAGEVLSQPFLPTAAISHGESAVRRSLLTSQLRAEALEFLRLVRINDPERILNLFPHELSGGMRQRVMIAMALSEKPSLLIADEPTSALDVTIQAQVLTLMKELMEEVQTSILFISHDLGVIAEMADLVGVMYAGHLAEFGPVREVFRAPQHPYTKALLRSIPTSFKRDGYLPELTGSVPNLSTLPSGCTFHPRCPIAAPACAQDPGPTLQAAPTGDRHLTACLYPERVASLP
jgi:peptide/nickel transport system ATP-binding protein